MSIAAAVRAVTAGEIGHAPATLCDQVGGTPGSSPSRDSSLPSTCAACTGSAGRLRHTVAMPALTFPRTWPATYARPCRCSVDQRTPDCRLGYDAASGCLASRGRVSGLALAQFTGRSRGGVAANRPGGVSWPAKRARRLRLAAARGGPPSCHAGCAASACTPASWCAMAARRAGMSGGTARTCARARNAGRPHAAPWPQPAGISVPRAPGPPGPPARVIRWLRWAAEPARQPAMQPAALAWRRDGWLRFPGRRPAMQQLGSPRRRNGPLQAAPCPRRVQLTTFSSLAPAAASPAPAASTEVMRAQA